MKSKFYIEYPLETQRFTSEDLKVVGILKEAGLKIGELFERQIQHDDLPGASFYPKDATKKELEEAAKQNPKILDPFTVVKRDDSGNLFAIPFHEEYKDECGFISSKLIEASNLVKNDSFKAFLISTAKDLLIGDYYDMERVWVGVENDSFLHLMIGPYGSYADRLFSLKKAYNFNLTYTATGSTYNPSNYVDVIRNIQPPFGSRARQDVPPEKIKVRVDKVACIAGRNAGLPARATNYPEDVERIRAFGLKIVIYTDNIQKRDGGMLLPLFRAIFDKEFQKTFSDSFIMDNATRLVMVHEVTEGLFQYQGAWDRLKGMFNYVFELHSSIVGIKACGYQVIKGILSQKELEAILYTMLMRTFSDYFVRKKTPQVENYLAGYRVFYNYCLEHGAIVLVKDTILPNPSKMFLCADQLANVVMHLFSEGTEKEAKAFFDRYNSEYMYEHFSAKLSKYEF